MNENKKMRFCGGCSETDSTLFTSNPPQVKCKIDGELHALGAECALKENEMNEPKEPRLTEQELAICNAVGAKWIGRNGDTATEWVRLFSEPPFASGYRQSKNFTLGDLRCDLFPSVKPGDCIEVK